MTAQWTRREVNPIVVGLEVAFGADVTSNPTTWTWTDLSVRMKGSAVITRGRADEATKTAPASCTITLDNTDSQLSPGHALSQWRGLWDLGTQMRLKVKNPTTGVSFVRCQGGVTELELLFPAGHSGYAIVNVTFRGVLYLLGQGDDLRSAMYRIISGDKPVAYWSMEDDKFASSLAEYHGGAAISVAEGGSFASHSPTSGASAPVFTCNDNTYLFSNVTSMSSAVTAWTVECYANLANPQTTGFRPLMVWTTPQGVPVVKWWLVLNVIAGIDGFALEGFDVSGNRLISLGTGFSYLGLEAYGVDLYISACVRLNAGAIQCEFAASTYSGIAFSRNGGSIAGSAVGRIDRVFTQNGIGNWTFGHLSIWDRALDTSFGTLNFPHAKALNGQAGDGAETRITNLAAAATVPLTMRATLPLAISTKMGPLSVASALGGMREAEEADLGILTDGLSSGAAYLPRAVRYNAAVALTLNAATGQVKLPFAPLVTDQRIRNKETVSRTTGSSFTAVGPRVPNQGVYPDQKTLNLYDDSTLPDHANFRLALGSIREVSVPSLVLDLRDRPEIIQPWLDSCDIGTRVQVTNLPSQFPLPTLDWVIEQYKETLDSVTWKVEVIGSPYAPWRAFTLDSATLGRLDGGFSKLNASVSTTATSWSVATTFGPLWTTAGGDLPLDLDCEGEQVQVTAISGASSPQTFTVTRSLNGIVKSHPANAVVSLYQPAVLPL